jgi:hypothetical protein
MASDTSTKVEAAVLPLGALQALLYGLLTAPAGVDLGLAARGLPADALDAIIVGDARLSAAARLDLYANMYFFRILDVLRDEFPRVRATVGEAPFHDLITDYLLAAPPAHPSLREVGGRLPAYLAAHALGVERPWLTELAALERTHRELFDGPDAVPLTMEALRSLPPQGFAPLPVRLVPCHRILEQGFGITGIWRADAGGQGAESAANGELPCQVPEARPETVLAWRRGFGVVHRVVDDAAELAMARQAAAGTTLGGLCETFVEARRGAGGQEAADPYADDGALAAEAFQLLARWVDDALLTAA